MDGWMDGYFIVLYIGAYLLYFNETKKNIYKKNTEHLS